MASTEQAHATGSVVTPGNHDGVHLGHRALVRAARQLADQQQPALEVVALTFDPHPLHVMAPERAPPLLTSPERRAQLLLGAGADRVVVRPFDAAFASLTPEQFVAEVLRRDLGARAVVVGNDFRFGAQRAGDVARLRELMAETQGQVLTVPAVTLEGEVVSSSHVRAALARGDVALAARMLTRVHDVTRTVIQGAQRGRTIGFPTANLELSGLMTPADGVYAVVVRVLDEGPANPLRLGVANLGVRPTVSAGRSLEVHLLDFAGDLYGKSLRVGFVARLRAEQKFESLDALRAQIARDVEAGRGVLAQSDQLLWAWV
ncbi:MAG: bifunctional riboflavin kinase/FAD synthetase [Myxococcales bacterium]